MGAGLETLKSLKLSIVFTSVLQLEIAAIMQQTDGLSMRDKDLFFCGIASLLTEGQFPSNRLSLVCY